MNQTPIFDNWQDIQQCESCEHWWNNTCDGSKSSCNAFKPTRRTEIPQKIKSLEEDVKGLRWRIAVLCVIFLIHLVGELL